MLDFEVLILALEDFVDLAEVQNLLARAFATSIEFLAMMNGLEGPTLATGGVSETTGVNALGSGRGNCPRFPFRETLLSFK